MEVTRELVLPAPREEVWEALTSPERLEEWFANDVEFDLGEGEGEFRWESGEVRRAVVEEADRERRLAIRWWDPDPTAPGRARSCSRSRRSPKGRG